MAASREQLAKTTSQDSAIVALTIGRVRHEQPCEHHTDVIEFLELLLKTFRDNATMRQDRLDACEIFAESVYLGID